MQITVECQQRKPGSKPNALRRDNLIPAVLYGHKGAESIALTINAKTVELLLKKAAVNNTPINLNITDLSWSGKTLLREVQKHPYKNYPYHLSFFAISSQDSVEVELSLHFVGEATGVKLQGGILDPILTQLHVKCAPDSISEAIEIDVSALQIGDQLLVKEIPLPSGVTALNDPEQTVVHILAPQLSTETETVAEESA
jgi:large subunit ribosomal protein L25